jgi:hypothetical protein
MSNYQDRAPRAHLNLPIQFISHYGLATGLCVNVSESGMLAAFDRRVDVWLEGDLSFLIEEQKFTIKARVVRIDGLEAGLWFRIENEADKATVRELLKLAEASKASPPRQS